MSEFLSRPEERERRPDVFQLDQISSDYPKSSALAMKMSPFDDATMRLR